MDRVHRIDERPFEEVQQVGVTIGITGLDQRHIGMLLRDNEADAVQMLHLAWHHKLKLDTPDPSFLWVDPPFHPRRLTQVAAVCRLVWRANKSQRIPYGFSSPTECFDAATGEFLFGPTRHGLTCATFVLAVFERAGLRLVHYSSWPIDRPGDADWQEKIVALLERTGATPEHVAAVRQEIGTVRYRPEEVAGAATVSTPPADFPMVAKRGLQILHRLQKGVPDRVPPRFLRWAWQSLGGIGQALWDRARSYFTRDNNGNRRR